jgi:SRSO17 transposase
MTPTWAQRREALVRDCIVSPDVFTSMVERLGDFVVPYQHALETEASQRNVHRYLQGLLSHVDRKNAEEIAALVDVERQVIQDFIGTAPWDHRPLIEVLVAQVIERLGEPNGVIAFDPSSFPKRGTHSVGVKRQWCGHRGKVDNCQVGVFMGYVSRHDHALLDFRLSLPEEWTRDEPRRQACHVPEDVSYPRFKGVWYAATNFAPIPLSDTSQGQYPRHHRRSDESPGRHAPGGCAARLQRTARASLA